jgi:membrane protease subunit HflK
MAGGNGQDKDVIDLEEVFGQWREKMQRGRGGGGRGGGGGGGRRGGPSLSSEEVARMVLVGLVGLLLLWVLMTTWYTVPQDSVALVQRFGKLVGAPVGPGLHARVPFGVDRVTKLPVKRVLKEEFGFTTAQAGVQSEYRISEENRREALMLTGDLNIANVEWVVQYRIEDPVAFLFKVRNVEETLRDVSEAITRRVAGDRSVTDVLTVGRIEIADQVNQQMQELLRRYDTGIELVTVQLQDVRPPGPVEASFNEVNEAKQEKERMINQAKAAYNKAIPAAEGAAARMVAEAEGYALDRVNRAQGDAARFVALHQEYSKAREVTRKRLYLETMNEVLPRVSSLVVLDADTPVTPFLGMDRLPGPVSAAAAKGNK